MKTTSCTMNTGTLKNYKKFRTIMYKRTDSKNNGIKSLCLKPPTQD